MSQRWRSWVFQWRALIALPKAIARDRAGVTLLIYALTLPVLLGFAGLAVEVGEWYTIHTKLQTAADAGALAGAWVLKAGGGSAKAIAVAKEAIAKNPVTPDSITINAPPTSGSYSGNNDSVQVVLSKQELPLFAELFNVSALNIGAQAVAKMQPSSSACLLALDPSSDPATVDLNGNANVQFGNCSMAANSSNPNDAILINGNATFTGQSIVTVGNYETNGNVSINLTDPAQTGASPVPDPFANLNVTSPAGCDYNGTQNYNSSATLQPGTYCGGFNVNGNATVTLEPGTYYIDGGNLIFNGNSTILCDCTTPGSGVTFVFTNQGGDGQTGTVTMNGNVTMNLQAPTDTSDPTDYPYAGMLFVQDRNAPQNENATFNGNVNSVLEGAMYFPNGEVVLNGNLSNSANCTELIAWQVLINGNAGFSTTSNCAAAQINPLVVTDVQLVE